MRPCFVSVVRAHTAIIRQNGGVFAAEAPDGQLGEAHHDDAAQNEHLAAVGSDLYPPDIVLQTQNDIIPDAAFKMMEVGRVNHDVHSTAAEGKNGNLGEACGLGGFDVGSRDTAPGGSCAVHEEFEGCSDVSDNQGRLEFLGDCFGKKNGKALGGVSPGGNAPPVD